MAKRIRMEFDDGDGIKYNIKLEGDVSVEKLTRVYEMMNSLGERAESPIPDTIGAKIWHVVEKYFEYSGFTSNMVLEKYEDEYNEPIKLSVISTYLARYSSRMKLRRMKTGREWTYSITNRPLTQNIR